MAPSSEDPQARKTIGAAVRRGVWTTLSIQAAVFLAIALLFPFFAQARMRNGKGNAYLDVAYGIERAMFVEGHWPKDAETVRRYLRP